jgi:hypothetical protein
MLARRARARRSRDRERNLVRSSTDLRARSDLHARNVIREGSDLHARSVIREGSDLHARSVVREGSDAPRWLLHDRAADANPSRGDHVVAMSIAHVLPARRRAGRT